MKFNVYSMKDEVSGLFAEPFFAPTDGVAFRKFANTMDQPNVTNKYVRKQDIKLFRLGVYDNEKGSLFVDSPLLPIELCSAANVSKLVLGTDVQVEAESMTEEEFAQERAKEA